jgi:hypothetical protein
MDSPGGVDGDMPYGGGVMAVMYLTKTERGVHGMSEADHKAWVKFKAWLTKLEPGDSFKLEYVIPRNIKHHRKFMALVAVVAEYSDVYDNQDKALLAVKIAAGHCDFVPNPITGELQAVPKSISFAAMGQDDFETFYDEAIKGVLKYVLSTMDEASLDHAVELVVRF